MLFIGLHRFSKQLHLAFKRISHLRHIMLNKYIEKRHIIFACFSLLFLIIAYSIQIKTPLQSDDYRYLFKGGSIINLYHHYMTWSGRILADTTSSSMLYFLNKQAYSLLNSAALILLTLLIALLPARISRRKVNYSDLLIFIVIFITYFVANTNLGQTTFWIVGSANYLWTNLYLVIYFHAILFLIQTESRKYLSSICAFIFGFVAGCTNENTGLFSFLFTIYVWSLCKFESKANKTVTLAFGTVGGLLGWLTLLLSPGNAIRANHASFKNWYDQSIFWRIDEHVFVRFPAIMENYWQVFLVIVLTLVMSSLVGKVVKSHNYNCARVSAFFLLAAILSSLMMLGAPKIELRSGNGALVFLLITYALISSANDSNTFKNNIFVFLPSFAFLLVYFIPSYYLIYRAYDDTHYQELVRERAINSAKENNLKKISIPNFFFSRTIKISDRFDMYHNPYDMGRYWGVDAINVYHVPFNFGVLAKENHSITVNNKLSDQRNLLRVFIYHVPGKPFYKNETHMTAELDFNPELLPSGQKVYIHLYENSNGKNTRNINSEHEFINADIGRSKGVMIGSKYYVDRIIPKNITANEIKTVNAGIF